MENIPISSSLNSNPLLIYSLLHCTANQGDWVNVFVNQFQISTRRWGMEGREVGFRAEFRCGSNLVFSRAGCCSGLRGSSNCFKKKKKKWTKYSFHRNWHATWHWYFPSWEEDPFLKQLSFKKKKKLSDKTYLSFKLLPQGRGE